MPERGGLTFKDIMTIIYVSTQMPERKGLTFKDTMNCFSSRSSLLSALFALSCSIISCRLLALLCHGKGGGGMQSRVAEDTNPVI